MVGNQPHARAPDLLDWNAPESGPGGAFAGIDFAPDAASSAGRSVDLSGAGGLGPPRAGYAGYADAPPAPGRGAGGYGGYPSSFGSDGGGPKGSDGSGGALGWGFSPAQLQRDLASKPVTQIVQEQGRNIIQLPLTALRAYQAAAERFMRPWSEFARLRPGRVVEGLRSATRRGEIQIYLQRNVLANTQRYLPNYLFLYLAMLFWFVCTSPSLLLMLATVGGGWGHALKNEQFRSKPWTLAIGGIQVPLGSNSKMAMLSIPTLLFLHFFMGPVLWTAGLYAGGVSVVHAALKDGEDHKPDGNDDRPIV